jgi:NAD+ kinase
MTSVPQEGLEHALEVLARGDYKISERSVAECEVFDGQTLLGNYRALNDVVIGWGASSRVITLSLAIDGEQVTSYLCDGLIVSTPTGSTGHSLSAGGPILQPETRAFVVSLVCPHALSHRPLVVPDASVLEVTVSGSPKELLLSVDGQEEKPVVEGNRLVVRRSPTPVRFIHPPGYSYFSVLRQKLGWRGSSL